MADFGTRRSPASAVAPTSPIPPSRAASLTAPPAPLHPAVPPTATSSSSWTVTCYFSSRLFHPGSASLKPQRTSSPSASSTLCPGAPPPTWSSHRASQSLSRTTPVRILGGRLGGRCGMARLAPAGRGMHRRSCARYPVSRVSLLDCSCKQRAAARFTACSHQPSAWS
ncbi:hypothetical protein CHLRE_02g074737v5 [Chlamydomonas reinhardtii]|uniref:Uncharacterized protein n=1 Tax=Chlamydomonas reinhardtii TaxID=3055 RepID=A0A2K3E047_CHLRE|nr:uncharacterized protein CHLRE_02g074737v5 [Chlamydomonas reinhardtii]PNW86139.1 hypothetical protein CHLRE_02g074737v5 [Chlamydomonas reinhardtii]